MFFRPKQRKQNHIADRAGIGEQHGEAVDADTFTARRRHAVTEGPDVVVATVNRPEIDRGPVPCIKPQSQGGADWLPAVNGFHLARWDASNGGRRRSRL